MISMYIQCMCMLNMTNIWYDMIWYDMIWYDMIWYDMIWYKVYIYTYILISQYIIHVKYHQAGIERRNPDVICIILRFKQKNVGLSNLQVKKTTTSTLSSLHLNKSNQTWPNLISYCSWPNKLIKCTTMKALRKCRNIYLLSAAHHQAYWIHPCQDHIRNYHIKYTKFQQHLISSHLPKCR